MIIIVIYLTRNIYIIYIYKEYYNSNLIQCNNILSVNNASECK